MKKGNLTNALLYIDSHDSVVRVLLSWRLWIVGAIIGALVASGIYLIFPPKYQAKAVAVVDHNLEEVWVSEPGSSFYFLGRETRKLEELAWSDEVLQQVVDQVDDVNIRELREEILFLSNQSDGSWNFFAKDRDPQRAELIASTWGQVYVDQVIDSIEIAVDLVVAREEINQTILKNQNITKGDIGNLLNRVKPDFYDTKGISPYVEIYLAQGEQLEITRSTSMAIFIISGSIIGALGSAFAALVLLRAEEKDEFLAQ